MITVTRLDGKKYFLNADLIETVESTPDTIITLTSGKKLVVAECADDIIDKIILYKKKINFQFSANDKINGNEV